MVSNTILCAGLSLQKQEEDGEMTEKSRKRTALSGFTVLCRSAVLSSKMTYFEPKYGSDFSRTHMNGILPPVSRPSSADKCIQHPMAIPS